MQLHLARLEAEQEAAIPLGKHLQSPPTASCSFLRHLAADVQNTASCATKEDSQLATSVDSQRAEIQAVMLGAKTMSQENFQGMHSNINYQCNQG